MAETFRNVRTNVLYMMRSDEKVILVTSTTTGEGKTFIRFQSGCQSGFIRKENRDRGA